MRTPLAIAALLFACSHAAPPPAPRPLSGGDWIARSDQNAQVLLEVQARFAPELAAKTGVSGIDDRISDFTPGYRERTRAALRQAISVLEDRRKSESDANVAQDLVILIDAAGRQIHGSGLQEKLQVPYTNIARLAFTSVRALLDPQIAPDRQPAALAPLRTYAERESD